MAAKPIKTNSEIALSKQMSVAFMQQGGKRLPDIHIFWLNNSIDKDSSQAQVVVFRASTLHPILFIGR